jgi:sugar (pentulose or hexulose) kinase
MVWLRNGTTFMNTVVDTFLDANGFESIMPKLVEAPPECGGLLALPFMDDEPGLNVSQGGTTMICGWNSYNATAGNVVKAALLSTIFNLKLGSKVLQEQGYPQTEIVLSGGLTKTPECGQIVADVFDMHVTLLDSAEEGCAWGPYCWPGTGLKDAMAKEYLGLTFCSPYP